MDWKTIEKRARGMKKNGMTTKISVSWCAEDILSANDTLSDKQIVDVLSVLEFKHDASIGINWDVINSVIEEILNDSKKGK